MGKWTAWKSVLPTGSPGERVSQPNSNTTWMNLPDEEEWVEKMPGLCGFCEGPPGRALATGTTAAAAGAVGAVAAAPDEVNVVRMFPL